MNTYLVLQVEENSKIYLPFEPIHLMDSTFLKRKKINWKACGKSYACAIIITFLGINIEHLQTS